MKYDANKYVQRGIGERIDDGDTIVWAGGNTEAAMGLIGCLVGQDDDFLVLRSLTRSEMEPTVAAPTTEPDAPFAKATFATGASRSCDAGRGRFDLIPYEAMQSLARRYEMGVPRFGARNWEKGQPLSRLLSSLRRHAHQVGYDFSEDHIGAVLWNAAAFVTMVERMRAGILPRTLDDIGFFLNETASPRATA